MVQQRMAGMWARTKWPRYAFVAGLVVGAFLGWTLHWVFTGAFRTFIVLVLLTPLVVLLIAYLRMRGRNKGPQTLAGPGVSVVTWDDAVASSSRRPAEARRDPIDVDLPADRDRGG